MAQIKKAKEALCEQIVDLYRLRDFILKLNLDNLDRSQVDEIEKGFAQVIFQNRSAFKSLC